MASVARNRRLRSCRDSSTGCRHSKFGYCNLRIQPLEGRTWLGTWLTHRNAGRCRNLLWKCHSMQCIHMYVYYIIYIYILISYNIVHVRSDRSSASWIRINKLLQAGNGHPNENMFTLSTLKSCRRSSCLQSCSKMDTVSLGKTDRL